MTAAILSAPDNQGFSGVVLNGSSYLTRGAAFTGAADSKLITGSFWIYNEGDGIVFDSAGTGFRINVFASNNLAFLGYNPTSTVALSAETPGLSGTQWRHVAFSFDMSSTSKRHIYIDGVSAPGLVYSIYNNDDIDFTRTDWSVGANTSGAGNFTGRLAEVWIAFGQYIDLSVGANLAKFISGGRPVALGSDGSTPTGSAPTLFLSTGPGFTVNRGAGGGMTLTGSLTSTSPIALP